MRIESMAIARCSKWRLALPLSSLRKIVATPWVLPLPEAPFIVVGLVNLHGTPLVVVDLSRQATEDFRQPALNSCIAIIETSRRCFGLLCDDVEGIVEMSGIDWQDLPELFPGVDYLSAGQPGSSDLLILRDPERWLSAAQEISLDLALDHYNSALSAPCHQ